MLLRSLCRTVRRSLGRYLAILGIITLGVGFFSGLCVTEKAMRKTADAYLRELQLYDYRLLSTLGFTKEDVAAFDALSGAEAAGAFRWDLLCRRGDGGDLVLRAHTILQEMNRPDLVEGRFPKTAKECLLDRKLSGRFSVGDTLELSRENSEATREAFAFDCYTIVGIVNSPEYLNFERGTTALAGGEVAGFVYLLPEGFTSEYFTELFLKLRTEGEIYSDDYQEDVDARREEVEALLQSVAADRFSSIRTEAEDALQEAKDRLTEQEQTLEEGKQALADGRAQLQERRAESERLLNEHLTALQESAAQIEEGKAKLTALEQSFFADRPEVQAQIAGLKATLAAAEAAYEEGVAAYEAAKTEAEAGFAEAEQTLAEKAQALADGEGKLADAQAEWEEAKEELAALKPPTVFALDRMSNVGYASLENDTEIVSGIAKVFPLFFFLVAALVCITTMTRMVSEKRTENGVLKALGFGDFAITGQYLLYAGSASAVGCVLGFFVGSRLMPLALWQVYAILYSIDRPIVYLLDRGLFLLCSLLYLCCALGSTALACRKELRENAAQLIRPAAPAAGKRVFLERIGFLWRPIPFLHKVSIRNILRYKKRMCMMIVGIGGCTALLLTGFGIRDSIRPIVDYQYREISLYDLAVSFLTEQEEGNLAAFTEASAPFAEAPHYFHSASADLLANGVSHSLHLEIHDPPPEGFLDLHEGSRKIPYPGKGEAVINYRFAKENRISVGDTVQISAEGLDPVEVQISGIFDNYIYDYVYLSGESYKEAPGCNAAYLHFLDGVDAHAAAAHLLDLEEVASVTVSEDMRTRVGSMLQSLDYIVLIVLVCAGALAFIVLFNLTNIMITERTRELATLKVLGFTLGEQNAYVFRENMVLTVLGAICGIPMGMLLLRYVMAQIKISSIFFPVTVSLGSVLLSLLCTLLFALVVDLALLGKTGHIDMAQAMKEVE